MQRLILAWCILSSLGLLWVARRPPPTRFGAITVERIDVVDADGTTRLVITDKERSPDPVVDGKPLPRSIKPAGIILYDETGNECGGIATAKMGKDRSINGALVALDYSRSEAIGFVRRESSRGTEAKFVVQDPTPPGPIEQVGVEGTDRISLGTADRVSSLELADTQGRPRIRVAVDASDRPSITILDEHGKVISSLP
jgi:hypothetical protein